MRSGQGAKPTVYKWLKQEHFRVGLRKAQDESKSLETPNDTSDRIQADQAILGRVLSPATVCHLKLEHFWNVLLAEPSSVAW